jgi:hypothetical protein
MILWTLNRTSDDQVLPFLVRSTSSLNQEGINSLGTGLTPSRIYSSNDSIQALDPINVVTDFEWTKSPKDSRGNTPSITLIEKRLLMNSNVANLANSVLASAAGISNLIGYGNIDQQVEAGTASLIKFGGQVKNLATPNGNGVTNQIIDQSQNNSLLVKALQGRVSGDTTAGQVIGNKLITVGKYASSFQLGNPVLRPYNFLYATELTGFIYYLPYFSNSYNENANQFGAGESNLLSGLTEIASSFASFASNIQGFLKPGTYIETAKQFNMGDSGRTVNIKFPLLNTGQFSDILKNWQLIFGLIYQNRPGRVTRSIIDVPVIYEVYSQGVIYMPYAYISSLSVNFLGSRRTINLEVPIGFNPGENSTIMNTIVPDAYEVNITLRGLNEETRNFLFTSVTKSPVTSIPTAQVEPTITNETQIQPPAGPTQPTLRRPLLL